MLPPLTFNAWLRWDIIEQLLPPDGRLLEIGPGVGAVSSLLVRRFDYVGVELSRASAIQTYSRVASRGGCVVNGSIKCLEAQFDLICAFEVLEHIEDDVDALRRWGRRLRDDGRLVLTVPADPELHGANDELAGHVRRYTRESLRTTLNDAGMEVERMEMIGGIAGYLLKWSRDKRAERLDAGEASMRAKTLSSGRIGQPGVLMGAVTWASMIPFRWLQRPFMPTGFGTGLAVTATKSWR